MLIFVLFGPIASALLCNCSEYKKECVPYCKSTYVYKNKLERNNITGEVKVVNKKPFIDLVKNKIQNTDNTGIVKDMPLAVPQIPMVTSSTVAAPQFPILTTAPQIPFLKLPKYELNGNTLKYNDIDYDVCNDRSQIIKLSGLDEEFKRIYEMISNTGQLRTRCPVQIATTRIKTVEETTTKTRTVETTSVQTRSSTETVLITTTKKVERLETITKRSTIRPNPIESTVTVSNRQCNDTDVSYNCNVEPQAPNIITVTRDAGMSVRSRSQMPSIVTVTRDSPMRNQPQNQLQSPSIITITRDLPTQQRVSTVFVNRTQSNDETSISTSTVIKTTVIPKIRTITKEITSTRRSMQADRTESTQNLKTRYITNVKTSTKTLYNTQKSTESTMYSMLLQLQDLLTKVKGIADSKTMINKSVKPSTIKSQKEKSNYTMTEPDKNKIKGRSKDKTKTRTYKNDGKSNEESRLNDTSKNSRSFESKEDKDSDEDSDEPSKNKSTNANKTKSNKKIKSKENNSSDSSSNVEQDKFRTILKELSIIKNINMSLIKKKDEPQTIKRSASLTQNKSNVSSAKTKSFDKSNSEDFTKKVLEVLEMKKTKDKSITITKTLTINKTNPYFSIFRSSQSLYQSGDSDKKVSKNASSTVKQTITLRQTVTKTIKESKSITKTTSKVKTKSLTRTKSLISILPVIVSSVNHSTENDSGIMGDVKDKINKIFKKQSQSQLQSQAQTSSVEYFHNFVSENLVSLASAISDIKKSEIKVKSDDDKVEKTVTIGQKENKKKIEIEINAMKNKFDKMLENLKAEMMKEETKKEVNVKDKEDSEDKDKQDLIKDGEDTNVKDDLKESHIIKHEEKDHEDEDKMKLKSILLFSVTPQSKTSSLPILSIEITTTIPKQVTFSSLIKQKSESLISEDESSSMIKVPLTVMITSTTTEEPSTVTVKSTTTEVPSTVTVKSTTTEEPSSEVDKSASTKVKTTVLDKITAIKPSSSISTGVLTSILTVTSSVSKKSEFKLSKTRPESSTVSKTKSCKRGSSECVIDIPVTAIPKSLDIIYE